MRIVFCNLISRSLIDFLSAPNERALVLAVAEKRPKVGAVGVVGQKDEEALSEFEGAGKLNEENSPYS